ncbi:MAG: SIS domain-containing protein [Candidatus Omnitrophica bacterium]|nr:SIS domain-containing protein [Candidatus Omnitrophota bacterium]MCM8828000.1 SIS domain-containing protein [Candidatus Omnitrophota bacterium]
MKKEKKSQIEKIVSEHKKLLKTLSTEKFQKNVGTVVSMMFAAIKNNKKIIVCGNGGSAADSQHLAGELVGRFQKEREALPCIAITTNTSILTAVGNDYSFEKIFSRQIEAIGKKGDILILISTSGESANILDAALTAKNKGIKTVSLTGAEPNKLARISNINIPVPSKSTPRIQELHSLIVHIICGLLEEKIIS